MANISLGNLQKTISNVDYAALPRLDFWAVRDQIHLNIRLPRIVPFSVISSIAIMYLFALWLMLVSWVRRDIRERTKDQRLIQLATVLVILFNFPGLLLYFLFRPPTFKEIEQAEVEEEVMRLELERLREWKSKKKSPSSRHPDPEHSGEGSLTNVRNSHMREILR